MSLPDLREWLGWQSMDVLRIKDLHIFIFHLHWARFAPDEALEGLEAHAILHIAEFPTIMSLWVFLEYETENGKNYIRDWYEHQVPQVRAEFDVTLALLGGRSDWEDPDDKRRPFKRLAGKHTGLGEIRFHVLTTEVGRKKAFKRRFRPVGIWPAVPERQFILLLGCEKSGRAYQPHAAFDLALRLKHELESGKGRLCERK